MHLWWAAAIQEQRKQGTAPEAHSLLVAMVEADLQLGVLVQMEEGHQCNIAAAVQWRRTLTLSGIVLSTHRTFQRRALKALLQQRSRGIPASACRISSKERVGITG